MAHIRPEHARKQKARRHRLAFTNAAVGVLQGQLEERFIGHVHHHVEQRINAGAQAQGFELLNAGQRMAGLQQFEHFVKQARLRHIGQQAAHFAQRCRGFIFKLEPQRIELGGKTHGADDAHRVFAVAQRRVANHADDFFLRVGNAIVVIDNDLGFRVVIHGVDGEVAPCGVFFHRAPDVIAQHPARAVNGMLHAG